MLEIMLKEYFYRSQNTKIYYEKIDNNNLPIIFIHGFGVDNRMWKSQFYYFSDIFKTIRYDLRGFGKSISLGNEDYSHEDDLRSFLEYMGVKRAHLIGLSFGGTIAINFTLKYPEIVDKLVIADSGVDGYIYSKEYSNLFITLSYLYQKNRSDLLQKKWLELPHFQHTILNPELKKELIAMAGDYSFCSIRNSPILTVNTKAIDNLGKITNKTLILIGEYDLYDLHNNAKIMNKKIPNSKIEIIPDTGHMTNMENPDMFNKLVHEFLITHENSN